MEYKDKDSEFISVQDIEDIRSKIRELSVNNTDDYAEKIDKIIAEVQHNNQKQTKEKKEILYDEFILGSEYEDIDLG